MSHIVVDPHTICTPYRGRECTYVLPSEEDVSLVVPHWECYGRRRRKPRKGSASSLEGVPTLEVVHSPSRSFVSQVTFPLPPPSPSTFSGKDKSPTCKPVQPLSDDEEAKEI